MEKTSFTQICCIALFIISLAATPALANSINIPILHYSFDDSQNPGTDDSNNGHDLTIPGSWSSEPGVINQAIRFEKLGGGGPNYGSDPLGPYTSTSGLNYPGPDGFTVMFWGFLQSGDRPVVRDYWQHVAHGEAFTLSCDSDETVKFHVRYAFSDPTIAVAPVSLYMGEWVHIAGVYDPQDLSVRIYINCQLADTKYMPAPMRTSIPPYLYVSGSWHDTSQSSMDEVRIYDFALLPEEICEISQEEPPWEDIIEQIELIEAKLDTNLDQSVSSRATQISVDAIEAKLDARLDDAITTRASQGSINTLQSEVASLEIKLDTGLDVPVSSRATQASVDNINTDVAKLEAKLDAGLDVPVSSLASQDSVNALTQNVASIEVKLDANLNETVSSRASQDTVDAVESKLDTGLDIPVSTRASQTSVDQISSDVTKVEAKLDAGLDVPVSTRASQDSLNTLQASVNAVETKLDDETSFTDDSELEAHHVDVTDRLDSTESKVDFLETKMDEMQSDIQAHDEEVLRRKIQELLARGECLPWMYTPEYLDAEQTTYLGGYLEIVFDVIQELIDNGRALGCPKAQDLDEAQCLLDEVKLLAEYRPPLDCKTICATVLRAYDRAVDKPGNPLRCVR
ncbi:LamG domain-containing protein [Acidobacteriota bacterium]